MYCIFCKRHSASSKSIEHIIPESLGNKNHTLKQGIVCDNCNNYFSRKVEGPLLNHTSFRNLRARYQVPSKKGIHPSLFGMIEESEIPVGLRLQDGNLNIEAERQTDRQKVSAYMRGIGPNHSIIFNLEFDPPTKEMSRFMAKMALETAARRFSMLDDSTLKLTLDEYYEPLRRWARQGGRGEVWPINQRQVFPERTFMRHPKSGLWVHAGFGHDLFLTRRQETYFAFLLYGYEFVINLGGPSIRGYEEWLEENNNISPLIERVGCHIEHSEVDGKLEVFIEGVANLEVGRNFDRSQMRNIEDS